MADEKIVEADYSKIEERVLAHMAEHKDDGPVCRMLGSPTGRYVSQRVAGGYGGIQVRKDGK